MCKNCNLKPVITISDKKFCKSCFLHYFEKKVKKTIRNYELIYKNDKIIVACSGGKDSTVLLYILNNYAQKRRLKPVEALIIDLGIGEYTKTNINNLTNFCKQYKIKLHKISLKKEIGHSVCYLTSVLKKKGKKLRACTICGILRRYIINKTARKLKATKLVTGHNLDDEAQTILMNQFKGNVELSAKLGPKTGVLMHPKFIPRIKPLYFCPEEEIILYSKLKNFNVIYSRCPCSSDSFRNSVRNMLNEFEKKYPGTKTSIVNSFLNMLPLLRGKYQKAQINTCKKCKEPAVKEICKVCELLRK